MSLIFRVIYAAHANGTHHKLALDALAGIEGPRAEDWRKVFLKHADKYLEGSKAPDTTFKDFKNHVLHVGDGYWGGAPERVEHWYGVTVEALRAEQWPEAVYAAGVLGHYYSDPVMPLHTAQTEAENSIHRAVEWSINRSYDSLRKLAVERHASLSVPRPAGQGWLREMTCRAAETSHRHYETLIAHYDFTRGVVVPEEGLDSIARGVVAELLTYASTGIGRILDAAVAESGATAPAVDLALDTVLATLRIPAKWIERKLSDAADRRVVQAMYDELKATGRVETTLPEDDRMVRDLHAAEVLPGRRADLAARRSSLIAEAPAESRPGGVAEPRLLEALRVPGKEPAPAVSTNDREAKAATRQARQRPRLAASDDVEAAPSIGPKTAARLGTAAIVTVGDLLAADPTELAERLGHRSIDADTIALWQDQACMVMAIPDLTGTQAQLLTGAGYRSANSLAAADPVALSADLLKYASTATGQSLLRSGPPPDLDKLTTIVSLARATLAA